MDIFKKSHSLRFLSVRLMPIALMAIACQTAFLFSQAEYPYQDIYSGTFSSTPLSNGPVNGQWPAVSKNGWESDDDEQKSLNFYQTSAQSTYVEPHFYQASAPSTYYEDTPSYSQSLSYEQYEQPGLHYPLPDPLPHPHPHLNSTIARTDDHATAVSSEKESDNLRQPDGEAEHALKAEVTQKKSSPQKDIASEPQHPKEEASGNPLADNSDQHVINESDPYPPSVDEDLDEEKMISAAPADLQSSRPPLSAPRLLKIQTRSKKAARMKFRI